jgi:cyanophycin synthetase
VARPGDLLLIFADQITRTWKQVIGFKAEQPAQPERPSRPVTIEPAVSQPAYRDGDALVRDGRGVRLARETDD